MKVMKRAFALATVATLVAGSAAYASTLMSFTEGVRHQVAGSTVFDGGTGTAGDQDSTADGVLDVGMLTPGDEVNIHGRIVDATDFYAFSFETAKKVNVEFILDGYFLEKDGSFEADSGYVAASSSAGAFVPNPGLSGTDSVFTFEEAVLGVVYSNVFSTDILAGDDPFIVSLAPGTYTFTINGANDNTDALYDIRLSAVPLPAGVIMLLTGLAGLAVARRRSA